jgi:hypothetical protein
MVTPTVTDLSSEHALSSSTVAKTMKTALTRASLLAATWPPGAIGTIKNDYQTPMAGQASQSAVPDARRLTGAERGAASRIRLGAAS